MQIRSVTLFAEPNFPAEQASAFFEEACRAFHVPVQTTRAALPPFPTWLDRSASPAAEATAMEQSWRRAGADYISLGPVRLVDDPAWLDLLPELIAAGQVLFASAEVADGHGRLDLARCQAVAGLIGRISQVEANGFGNLYFCATANCGPGVPFFPVAYHGGGPAAFAIAIEGADLAVQAVAGAGTLDEARQRLVTAIEDQAWAVAEAAGRLAANHHLPFLGLDFTLAPFPKQDRSIGAALEGLGLAPVGAPGSLFGAAFLTEAIGRANFPRLGFSGLMFPVLEDAVLAARHAQGALGASELLSYAAVCGAGVDLLPLPGDSSQASLTGLLLDMSALALRLDKPLTARIMLLPGLKAGEPVHFDFDYFADSRVGALRPLALSGLASTGATIALRATAGDGHNHDG